MRDDEPVRRGARPVLRDPLRRHPARPLRARHGRIHRGADPRRRRRVVPRPVRDALDRGHRRRPGRPPAGPRSGHRRVRGPARRDARPAPLRLGDMAPEKPAHPAGLISRQTEQTHLLLGLPGMGRLDERRYAAAVIDAAVGGGMSSRLFQEIREKRGLVYSVGSALTHYAGTGSFSVYAGCSKKRVPEVLRLVREELARVAAEGLTPEEVARGRGQLQGNLVLGLEDTGSRMSRLGKSELSYGEYLPVREVLARLDGRRRGAGPRRSRPTCSPATPASPSSARTASRTSTGCETGAAGARRPRAGRLRGGGAGLARRPVRPCLRRAEAPPGVDKLVHGAVFAASPSPGGGPESGGRCWPRPWAPTRWSARSCRDSSAVTPRGATWSPTSSACCSAW